MAESQSRYGIMEELNNRKINEKEKLANIERETDQKTYETETQINRLLNEVESKEKRYKLDFVQWKREKTLALKLLKSDADRKIDELETEIKTKETNYIKDFTQWKSDTNLVVERQRQELQRYKDVQDKKISEKKEVITEIEKGITSLKEMSKEQAA